MVTSCLANQHQQLRALPWETWWDVLPNIRRQQQHLHAVFSRLQIAVWQWSSHSGMEFFWYAVQHPAAAAGVCGRLTLPEGEWCGGSRG